MKLESIIKASTYVLECKMHFICEQRTESYLPYCSGVAQQKNVFGTKSAFVGQAMPGIERYVT